MKKYSAYLILCAVLVFASCTKISVNNDPVIGKWTNSIEKNSVDQKNIPTDFEWIFNDAYLGRYHQYTDDTNTFSIDFSWKKENDTYTIIYMGTDIPDDVVQLVEGTILQSIDGEILAERK